jgi:hypothetical protein
LPVSADPCGLHVSRVNSDPYSVKFGYRKASIGFHVLASADRPNEAALFIRGRRFLSMSKMMKAIPSSGAISHIDRLETKSVVTTDLVLLSLGFDLTLFESIAPQS